MYKLSERKMRIAQRAAFALVAVCLIAVLWIAKTAHNDKECFREDRMYETVENVKVEKREDTRLSNATVSTCCFKLEDIHCGDAFVFFVNHHNIEVFIEKEEVYTFKASKGPIRTTGGVWVKVPLEESDEGKEVRVVLTPVYENYQNIVPKFYVGAESEIYKAVFYTAIPMLVLSMAVVFAGMFLIFLALYNTYKKRKTNRLYALGLMAISAGVWRFTYDNLAYLVFGNKSVLIYNLSVISLMVVAISMLNSIDADDGKKTKKMTRLLSVVYSVLYIAQLLLQAFGVRDLRQMLWITHATILFSAVVFFANSVYAVVKNGKDKEKISDGGCAWLLGMGVTVDLLIYYFAKTSVPLLFTLMSILCFSMLEGIRLLITYIEHKNQLEEMKIQLELSRTTTMMSQIRSHFVFNVLNAISGMCKYDPQKADDTIIHFAKYLRNNINIMEDDKNILFATDVRQLEDYVALEQVRFGDKIEFYTDIEFDNFMIPPLILQPVVENAIKHGISKKEGNGTIILRSRDEGDAVTITVEDDGVGFNMDELDKDSSVGIRNIKFRLEHLVKGTIKISSEPGKGTVVTISIPKEGGRR